ncbi:MAG: DNA gyrase [Oscillospiraceae bacterium]
MSITQETRMSAYLDVLETVPRRKELLLAALGEYGELTAEELALILFRKGLTPAPLRTFTAPRLTELKRAGRVEVCGKRQSETSGKLIAVWRLR